MIFHKTSKKNLMFFIIKCNDKCFSTLIFHKNCKELNEKKPFKKKENKHIFKSFLSKTVKTKQFQTKLKNINKNLK